MSAVFWLALALSVLCLVLLVAGVWALRQERGPAEPSAAAREIIDQVDRDEGA